MHRSRGDPPQYVAGVAGELVAEIRGSGEVTFTTMTMFFQHRFRGLSVTREDAGEGRRTGPLLAYVAAALVGRGSPRTTSRRPSLEDAYLDLTDGTGR